MSSVGPGGTRRLAIVGAGSSGLVTLKLALEKLPSWDVRCFEKTGDFVGSWGRPHRAFVSTSTKYTTQFACYRRYDDSVEPAPEGESPEFFRDGEFGEYLRSFVAEHDLAGHIELRTAVSAIEPTGDRWLLRIEGPSSRTELFDAVVVCTGLAARPRALQSSVEVLRSLDESRPVAGKRVVVLGGGESAVDFAHRLAHPELGNRVFLSLAGGIRVSPRYHPIRGVPSDFLRTRLLLSIHLGLRNAIGQRFVEARIKYQETFERIFRSPRHSRDVPVAARDAKRAWSAKLTERSKDRLFNVFHNKSDDFLDSVADVGIEIVGPPLDEDHQRFAAFDEGGDEVDVRPDFIVPMIGYESALDALSGGAFGVGDFYLGCVHRRYDNLFLVGFARPIIGSIPPISEMQARFVLGMLAGEIARPANVEQLHSAERKVLYESFPHLDAEALYPVEMIPYCNLLARRMQAYPTLARLRSPGLWMKLWLSPASTLHYVNEDFDADFLRSRRVHTPAVIVLLLMLVKIFDAPFRLWRRWRRPA